MSATQYSVDGEIAVIRFDNPPVNSLGHDLRIAIAEYLSRAISDPLVKAIVLTGSERAFSGGADVKEFNSTKATAEPNLRTLISTLEESGKPTIAAISGVCLGGGLELAMGCHFRVGVPGARIALPEVKLGLLPGAGGTQRLPRLIGVEAALRMIITGDQVLSEKLKDTPLFDTFIEGDLLAGALEFAHRVIAEQRPLKRVRDIKIDPSLAEPVLQIARDQVQASATPFPAPLKCIDAIAASFNAANFEEGLSVEREAFFTLLQSTESKALRHAFFSERAASKIDDIPQDTPQRKIEEVGIIGAGTMGAGIAMNFLNAGMRVVLLEMKQEALDRGVATIRKNYENNVKKGKLSQEMLEQRLGLLVPSLSYDDLKTVDLAIEAVFEDIQVKENVFRKLDEVCKADAILASNTSTLDINRIAGFTRRPEAVVGLHFFSPANVMKLLEVIRADNTANDVMVTVMDLSKRIRKTAVVSGVCDGFIGNRMIMHYIREANLLIEEGASPQQVDHALERFGMAMGPFRMADLAGNDIGWSIRKRRYAENPAMHRLAIADRLCELGRFGQKSGSGWYRYETGNREALHDPLVDEVIAEMQQKLGISPHPISDEEIVDRCIFALVNEGARIVEEGIAARASDIDIVYLTGYGFPMHRGGPMFYADTIGLAKVVQTMKGFRAKFGDKFWEPAALLVKRLEEVRTIN